MNAGELDSIERETGSGVQSSSGAMRALDALTCALLPGYCVGRAAADATAGARMEAERAVILAEAAGHTAAAVPGSIASGLTGAIREAGAPIAETASAARYVAVGATIAVVAIVVAVLAIVARTYL